MEEVQKIKPYIAHLNKQLKLLKPEIDKMTLKPLDEQLILMNDERSKLELTNKYSYVLSSLMFSYMKVLNVKDMAPIMVELERVKKYMNKAKELDQRNTKEKQRQMMEQENAKKVIKNALDGNHTSPAISKVNFQGKHTKFDETTTDKTKMNQKDINVNEITNKIKESKLKQKKISERRKNKGNTKVNKVSKKK